MNIKVTIFSSSINTEFISSVFDNLKDANEYLRKILNLWVYRDFKPMSPEELEYLIKTDDVDFRCIGRLTTLDKTKAKDLPLLDHVYGLYDMFGEHGCYYICVYKTNEPVTKKHPQLKIHNGLLAIDH